MSRLPRSATAVAGLLLLGTAAFHGSGYRGISLAITGSSAGPFLQRAVPGLWLFFSWHLAAAGLAALWASLRGGAGARPLVGFLALLAVGDTVWVFTLAGFFAGTALLALAAVGLVVAAVTWQIGHSSPGG